MKHKRAFNIVRKHINNWDTLGLLAGGAPLDEYDIETTSVVNALPKVKNQIDLANIIKNAFDKAFDVEHRVEDCMRVSEVIWEELMKEKDITFFN